MKFSKEIDGQTVVIIETNPNHFNLLEKEGFKKVTELKKK